MTCLGNVVLGCQIQGVRKHGPVRVNARRQEHQTASCGANGWKNIVAYKLRVTAGYRSEDYHGLLPCQLRCATPKVPQHMAFFCGPKGEVVVFVIKTELELRHEATSCSSASAVLKRKKKAFHKWRETYDFVKVHSLPVF